MGFFIGGTDLKPHWTAKYRSVLLATFVCLSVPTVALSKDQFGITIGSGSFLTHPQAFEGLVDTFIGSYSSTIQDTWFGVDLGEPTIGSVTAGAAASASDTRVSLTSSWGIGVSQSLPNLIPNQKFGIETAVSLNSSTYYFPDGILPFVDPITLEILTFEAEAQAVSRREIASVFDRSIMVGLGAGLSAAMSSADLTSALLDVHASGFHTLPFTSFEVSIGDEMGNTKFTVRKTPNSPITLKVAYQVRW